MAEQRHVEVLIVGGGLTGLSAAAFLAQRGVDTLLVERRGASLAHPRARAVNPRTMETFRALGLTDAILQACDPTDVDGVMVFADTLAASERRRLPLSQPTGAVADGDMSPSPWAPISQHRLEALLRERAVQLGADVRFGTELRGCDQDEGVSVQLYDTLQQRAETVRAEYLVAADGSRSDVRRLLGIPVLGPGTLGHTVTFVFHADLSGPLRERSIAMAYLDQPEQGTVLLTDGAADCPRSAAAFTDARCAAAVRAATGVGDLDVELVPQLPDGTKVLSYEISAWVAERFRDRRVLLAGDAAHVMPPVGAFGASTGIQDAHNLAWRLAAVVSGQAGPGLLDCYEAERRPVASLTLEQAMLQMRGRTGRSVPHDHDASPLDYYTVVFGYRYHSADIVGGAGDAVVPPQQLRAQPGTRAPHLDIVHDGRRMSTIDLCNAGFVLLTGPGGQAWAAAGRAAVPDLGADLRVLTVGDQVQDVGGVFADAFGIAEDGAVLVRPDGFVAWRRPRPTEDPARELSRVLTRVLHRPTNTVGGTRCAS